MPIKDILNKVANKEAIEDQEYKDLGAWVLSYPRAAPIINKMMQGGAGAASQDELELIQQSLYDYKGTESRRELEAAAARGTTLGSKIKDLKASFGEMSAAVPGVAQKSAGFLVDLVARGMAAKAFRPDAVPADFRQKVEEGVGKAGTKSMEKVIELLERGRGVEKGEAKTTAASMASDFADETSLAKYYADQKSPELLARQQLSQERGKQAYERRGGGLIGSGAEFLSQAKDLATDPALLANMAAGQLPIAGVAMATGVFGTAAAVASGAVMQGADVGGQVYDDLMKLPDEAWEGNEAFASRVAAGEDPAAVKQDIANAKARQAFVISGAASAALNSTPWGSLSERSLAMMGVKNAASTNIIKAIGRGAGKAGAEGITETTEEGIGALVGNIAKAPITHRDIFEDVGTAMAQGFFGSVAGPSIVAGQVEAMAERRKAMAKGAPPSSGQMISKPAPAPTAAPTAATQATQPAAPQDAPVAPTTGPEVQNAPPVAADEAEARGQSSILSSQLEAKREDIAMQFEDLLAANPDDANMASEAQAWRQKNPLKDAEVFEAYYEQVRLGTIESMAMQDPRTQEAEQQAQVVQGKTEQVMALVESNDTTSAPPPGVTVAQMQAAHADGGKAMQEEAKAAQENARTVQQTVAKEIGQETPKPEIAKTVQKRQKEGAQELSTYIEAVNAGAVSMDPAKFQALGVKAGMSEEAVAMKMATVQKKQNDKAAEAAEEQGFTQAPRGEGSQNLSGLNTPPTAAPGALSSVRIEGKQSSIRTASGKVYGVRLAVMPLEAIVTSDMPNYPQEVQPRDRSRFVNNEMVRKIGNDLDPDLLLDSKDATSGAPIIGPDGVVEGGNGRVMGMRLALGKPGWSKYQAALEENAARFGIAPEELLKIKNPVLVRVRESEVKDRGSFARELNESMVTSMDLPSQAKADAKAITDSMLALMPEEDAQLTSRKFQDFMTAFVRTVVPQSEMAAMYTKDRSFSVAAIMRARLAIFAKAFGSASPEQFEVFLAKMAEETSPDGMNILNAMRESAPLFMALEGKVDAGLREKEYSIAANIIDAAVQISNLRESGTSLAEFIAQGDVFAGEIDPMTSRIMALFDANARSTGKIQAVLKEYARLAIGAGDIGGVGLFGQEDRPTRDEMWSTATRGVKNVSRNIDAAEASNAAQDTGANARGAEQAPRVTPSGDLAGPGPATGGDRGGVAQSPSFGSKNRIFTEQSREEALARLRAKMQAQRSTLNSMPGMDPELMRDGMLVVGFYLEAGVRKFVEVSARVAEDLGATVRELRPYLRSWYNGARDMMEDNGLDITGMDSPDEVAIQLKKMVDATPLEVPMPGMATPLVEALLAMGRLPSDNRQLRAMLAEIDGKAPDDVRMKEGQEALEVVMALNGRATIAAMRKEGASTEEIFGAMSLLYQSQPRLEIRTSTSLENQAYSTPLPLSFLAGELTGIEKADTYEPTAGNGMLLIGADASRVWANELDPMRYERLQAMGFKSTRNGDAAEALSEGFIKPKSMDAVIANPPFGAIVIDGEKVTQTYDNYQFSKIDHLIAAESLRAMKDNGRAVLIIGGVKFAGKESMADKVFLNWLHRRYNVIGAFQADGALYQRQGAAWPVRVLVINGRGQSARLPNAPIPEAKTWEEVLAHGTAILGSEAFGKRDADGARDIPEQQGGETRGNLGPTGGQDQRADQRQQEPGPGPGSDGQGTPEPGREERDRGAGDGNRSGVPASDDAGLQRSGADGTSAGASGSDGEPIVPDGSRSSVDVAVDLEALTQPYTPKTYTTELDQGVYVPTNLKVAMEEGEAFLREKIGDPVLYVQEKLKYNEKELKDALMGLQVESVAASIYHMENGRATIIADDTGIGKGRQAYMMIRWAILNGKIPVFMTEKPSLFSAIYQDAMDCGDNGLLKPYIVNDDAWVEIDRGDKVEAMFKANKATRKAEHAQISATGELPDGRNAIFVTYSQFQMKNVQRAMLANIAPKAILVMDEAHLASGEESARGEFFRKIMKSFQGGGYFSATWAKRPGNMSLYTMSAIGDLGMTSDELSNAVARGGLPLQSIIASSMAKNSMFYRRERSFEGVEYNTVVYGQDGETSNSVEPGEHAAIHDRVTECFRAIIEADRVFSGWFENELKPQLEAQGALKSGTKTTESALTRAPFTSIVHNGIRLISLSLKADWVADMAIRALKNGEAPVIALENTAGTFLRDYATTNGLKKGSPLADFGWNQVLRRYLDRTRYYNITNENGKTERVEVPLEWLPAEGVQLYEDALAMISELDVNAPASPIDWIKFRLRKEGYSVEEITGQTRSIRVDYGAIVPVVDVARDGKKDHEKFRRDFNSGKLDVVIANVAGATGISLHCDKRWTDPNNIRRRHMVVAQAPQDINIFKQMLGRVHRTGQLVPPKYSILSLDLPSEFRPIAMLQKKFKSLNASTSSNTKGNMDVHGVDLLNRYGDEVVEAKLRENPEMASWLGIDLQEESDKTGGSMVDIAKDATGKLAILPVSEQVRFYEMVIPPYLAYIDFLTRTGQNRLITRMLDYRATEVARKVIYPGTGVQGPFSDPAWIVELKGRNLTMAIKPENVQEEIDAALGELTPSEHRTAMLAGAAEEWNAFSAMIETSEAREKAQEAKRRTADRLPEIGSQWKIKLMGDDAIGVVVRLRREEGKGNPYAPSKWHVRLATNASCGHFEIPLTTFSRDSEPMMGLSMQEVFAQDAGAMQKIRMIMGNIFGAYTQLDKDGEIVSFSMEDGSIQTGMHLPKSFDITKDIRSEVKIQGGQNITDIMVKLEGTVDPFMVPDEAGAIVSIQEGQAIVELDSTARANVLKWTALTGKEFTNGKAVIPVGEQTTKAFENVTMKMDRDVLQDIGVMKDGMIDPSAMKDPNNILDMTPEFIRSCCDYLNKHGIQADGQRMGSIMEGLRRKRATISSNAIRMTHLAERIRNREPIDLKTLKSFVQELFGRSVRKIDAKKAKASESASRDAREILNQCKAIGQLLARTNGMSKIEGRRVKTGLQNYQVENTFGARIRSMFPFIPAGYEGFNEIAAYTEYSLWAYNQKHPEEPINNLADSKNQAKFIEYLSQGQKLQANLWLTAAAFGIGSVGALAGSAAISPFLFGATLTAIGVVAARSLTIAMGRFIHRLTPTGKILAVQANGSNQVIVENLNQTFNFAQKLDGESGVYLERVSDRIMREAVRAIHGKEFARETIESSIWTSKEVQDKMREYGRAIGDYLEGIAPLPPEIESISNAVEKLRGYWADHIQDVGGNVIDGHFHRVYDFDGLQAMKGDNKALKRLVKDMAVQTMANDPERVEEIARRHLVPLGKASEILTMTILQKMYDGTEESKKNAAKLQSQSMDRFVAKLLNDEYGEVDRKLFNIIMGRMKNQVSPYTASGMKRRSIPFQLPETWALSDGSEVTLVERDYFKVQAHYNETMARSVAQKKVFLKGQSNRFLNSITDPEERESIKQAIRNELWHRYFSESAISEKTRKAMKAHRDFNSVVLLGLSPMFVARNLLFGPPKAMALVGYKAFFKGGAAMRFAIPGRRGEEFERARVAGAIMDGVVESTIGNDRRLLRAFMFAARRSQQAVDVAGFYAGIAYSRTAVELAAKGDPEAMKVMREVLGPKLAEEVAERDTQELTQDEEDLFGLYYRNLISGSGRGFNLPTFMSSEVAQWILQMKRIPMEDSLIFATRIAGTRAEARYWTGAAFSGALVTLANAIRIMIVAALTGDEPDEEEKDAIAWIYTIFKNSGALQLYEPIFEAFIGSGAYGRIDGERILLGLHGSSLPIGQAVRAWSGVKNELADVREEEGGAKDVLEAMGRASLGYLLQLPPAVKQVGLKDEAQEFQRGE